MRIPSIALAFLALAACSSDSTDNNPPADSDVLIVSGAATKGATAYAPNPFTISLAGQPSVVVKWGNDDGTSHTVTADGGTFDSGSMGAGGSFSHTFAAVGNFPYHCTIHAGMVGTVVVTL